MQNNNRKILDTLVSRTKIYLVIILILLIFICIKNTSMIIPSVCIFTLVVLYSYYTNTKGKSTISETIQDLSLTVDSAAKTSLINSPFPLIILETDGNVIWKSSKFTSEFANIDINTYIKEISNEIKNEIEKRQKNNKQDIVKEVEIDKKVYKVVGKYVSLKKNKNKKEYIKILKFI